MRLLLDTHALLWWWAGDARLSARAKSVLTRSSNEVMVSAATAWEIAIKHRIGKLPSQPLIVERFAPLLLQDGFTPLHITHRHALHAGDYPQAHRDPFDRLLAAQSELEDLALVTADPQMAAFPGPRLW
jgi:PIN domain nuclease of toxin-antitoxin system